MNRVIRYTKILYASNLKSSHKAAILIVYMVKSELSVVNKKAFRIVGQYVQI